MTNRQITVQKLVATLWQDRWLITGVALAVIVLSIIYAMTRKPLYESQALLAPAKGESSQLGALSAMAGQLAGIGGILGLAGAQGADVDEAVAVLKSRQFTDAFLRKNQIAPHLFPDLWDARTEQWKSGASERKGLASKILNVFKSTSEGGEERRGPDSQSDTGPSSEEAYKRFDQLRTVTVDRRTSYVKLAVRARTPELANRWASALIEDLNDTMRLTALEEARLSVEALAKKMETEQVESIRNTSATLLESQLQRQVVAEVRKEFALRVLDPPILPEQRFYPRRTRMVAIGGCLGFMLGCLFSLGLRAWRARTPATPLAP